MRLTNRGRAVMRRKILIVDDNVVNRQILRKLLNADYEVLEAENGRVALDILQKAGDGISAVLLDIIMPEMDGYEALTKMRADAVLSKIPVLVMTGSSDENTEVRALSLGANDFLTKPYKPAVIRQRLENAIDLRETAEIVTAVEKDELTGVYSKAFFYAEAEALLEENPDTRYDIIFLDIERFRRINELFGTRTGDALLKHVSEIVVRNLSGGGLCGRIGADRFACLVPHRETYDIADFEAIAQAVNRFPITFDVNINCGVYVVEDRSIPASVMCDRAMLACDSVKGKYGAYFAYYDEALRQKSITEQLILDGMRAGLAEGQFTVYYQPKYDLATGEMVGAEALVRWQHPKLGLLLPHAFIPLFEKNGFIMDMDRYVWRTVCGDMRAWREAGHRQLPVSVNVSRADIYHPELAKLLVELVEAYGLAPEMLCLEITESAYMEDNAQLTQAVTRLKALGFPVEMDDFGAGYSSLHMLSSLPIRALKLDMRFVWMEDEGEREDNILDGIFEFAGRLKLPVIAEGVETESQSRRLHALGCGYAQGYYYEKPVPRETFAAYLP